MTIILEKASDFTLEELQSAVNGNNQQLEPGLALTLLAGLGYSGIVSMLESFIDDKQRSNAFRAHAVHLLAKLNPPELEKTLLNILSDSVYEVARAAARALGRIGGLTSFEPLKIAAQSRNFRLGRDSKFATTLLAARHGFPLTTLLNWGDATDLIDIEENSEAAIVQNAHQNDINAALEDLNNDPLDMLPFPSASLLIQGQGFRWLLLVNSNSAELLDKEYAPALLAVLAEWDPSDDRWFEGYLLIANHSETANHRAIGLIDTVGDVVMKGNMTHSSEDWFLTLQTSISTMLNAKIEGTFSDESLTIESMQYSLELTGRKKSRPFFQS